MSYKIGKELRKKKIKKGEKKGGKLHEKREKGLKNASFRIINFKSFRGGSWWNDWGTGSGEEYQRWPKNTRFNPEPW